MSCVITTNTHNNFFFSFGRGGVRADHERRNSEWVKYGSSAFSTKRAARWSESSARPPQLFKITENFPSHDTPLKVLLFLSRRAAALSILSRATPWAAPLLTGHISDLGPNALTSAEERVFNTWLLLATPVAVELVIKVLF